MERREREGQKGAARRGTAEGFSPSHLTLLHVMMEMMLWCDVVRMDVLQGANDVGGQFQVMKRLSTQLLHVDDIVALGLRQSEPQRTGVRWRGGN